MFSRPAFILSRSLVVGSRSLCTPARPTTIGKNLEMPSAAYLLVQGSSAALIDNYNSCGDHVPAVLDTLAKQGLSTENVQYIVLGNVDLTEQPHGVDTLVQRCPNAKVLAHPAAVKHISPPNSTIDANRILGFANNSRVFLGNTRQLRIIHTDNCNIALHDVAGSSVFAGNSLGASYTDRCLQHVNYKRPDVADNIFLFPKISQANFDVAEATRSLQKMRSSEASNFYLSHFDRWPGSLEDGIGQVIQGLRFHHNITRRLALQLEEKKFSSEDNTSLFNWCFPLIQNWFREQLLQRGLNARALEELHHADMVANAHAVVQAALDGSKH